MQVTLLCGEYAFVIEFSPSLGVSASSMFSFGHDILGVLILIFLSAPTPRCNMLLLIRVLVKLGNLLQSHHLLLGEVHVIKGLGHPLLHEPTFKTVEGTVCLSNPVILDGPHFIEVGFILLRVVHFLHLIGVDGLVG